MNPDTWNIRNDFLDPLAALLWEFLNVDDKTAIGTKIFRLFDDVERAKIWLEVNVSSDVAGRFSTEMHEVRQAVIEKNEWFAVGPMCYLERLSQALPATDSFRGPYSIVELEGLFDKGRTTIFGWIKAEPENFQKVGKEYRVRESRLPKK